MSKCPNCGYQITELLSKEGGECPRCTHFILAQSHDFDLEASDTQERLIPTSGFGSPELEMITYEETDEMEATELIGRLPIMSKGSVGDDAYQEDFPDEDFIDEEDCIVMDSTKDDANTSGSSTIVILVLVGIAGILGGYLYSLKQRPVQNIGQVERVSVDYNGDVDKFIDPEELAREKKAEEEKQKKAEEEQRVKENKKRVQRQKRQALEIELDEKTEILLENFLANFMSCSDREAFKNPDFEASITYRITIEKTGMVSNPSISIKGDKTDKFSSCLYRAVKNWQFPKRDAAVTIQRTY